MNLKILAVISHPADAFDMIGGTLANHVADGDDVVLVILQGGNTSNLFALSAS